MIPRSCARSRRDGLRRPRRGRTCASGPHGGMACGGRHGPPDDSGRGDRTL